MIEVNNLTQIYKSGKGIFDLSFTIKEGEVFGYLGPNGAGKTTTIRNLLGFANATKGKATINALDCRKDSAKLQSSIGYLPGEMSFFDNMNGIQFLKFMCDMRKTTDTSIRDNLIDRLELDTNTKIKKMSKGMKQKVGIITAFMHDPSVYILDEPTSGLDPFMQNVFMELVNEEKGRGKTIMMSSHIFEEVQKSCDKAGIIREGHLVAVEDIKSLNQMKHKTYVVSFKATSDMDIIYDSKLKFEKETDNRVVIQVGNDYKMLFETLAKCNVTSLDVKQRSLEDIFMKYYGKEGEGNE